VSRGLYEEKADETSMKSGNINIISTREKALQRDSWSPAVSNLAVAAVPPPGSTRAGSQQGSVSMKLEMLNTSVLTHPGQ